MAFTKNTFVSGNAGYEKNLHPAATNIKKKRFFGDIPFSFLVYFALFDFCRVFLFVF